MVELFLNKNDLNEHGSLNRRLALQQDIISPQIQPGPRFHSPSSCTLNPAVDVAAAVMRV